MLQPTTIRFLKGLKRHNNKTWFDAHKPEYLDAKTDFETLVSTLLEKMGVMDPSLRNLQLRDCVFRIYRDVRFSKDKTPYKTHLAAGFNQGGKKVHFPGYYLHIAPGGETFCGGGIWRPDGAALKKIRQEIDYNYEEFHQILQDRKFRRLFGNLEDEESLQRAPQGYSDDNPAIEYLKMRNYIAGTGFSDDVLTSRTFSRKVMDAFTAMKPMIDFLGRALD
jgi:uncharacterized protein (TIGR02453 family)